MTVERLYKICQQKLAEAAIENPEFNAAVIISDSLNIRFNVFYCCLHNVVSNPMCDKILKYIDLRCTNYPLQYIVNEWEFHDILLELNPNVFIPRFETEEFVERIISKYKTHKNEQLHCMEIGTGSGAIAIALLNKLPNLHITATDISYAALKVAKRNSIKNHVNDRIAFIISDLFDSIGNERKFDFIVSNPPYVDPDLREKLQPELFYEPQNAIFCGDRGRDIPKKIIKISPNYLKSNGYVFLEIADYNAESLCRYAISKGFDAKIVLDQNNLKRFIFGRKKVVPNCI